MAAWSRHRLKVAWRSSGASPKPMASSQPGAAATEACVAGEWRQKGHRRLKRTDPRVSAATGPLPGGDRVGRMERPAQVPRQLVARSLSTQHSRAWSR